MTDQLLQNQEAAHRAWRNVIEPQPIVEKSTLQKARGFLGNIIPALAEVNPYSLMALGKDLSHWSPDDEDIEGYDFLIFKIGGSENAPEYGNPYLDDKFLHFIDRAYMTPNPQGGLGVPVLVYFMDNPRVYLENQMTEVNLRQCSEITHPILSMVLPALHNGASWKYQVYGFYFDIEEASYWMSRGYTIPEYWQRLFEDEMRDRFLHKIKANESPYPFPKMHLGTYSRRSFLLQHFDPGPHGENDYSIMSYIRDHPDMKTWPANYPQKVPNVSCAEIRAKWLPRKEWVPYKLFDEVDDAHPTHAKPWDIWQFNGEPDLNLWNGTPAEMYKEIGFTPRPIPTVPDPTKMITVATTTRAVNVRLVPTTANNNPVKLLPAGVKFEVVETRSAGADTWRRGPGFIDLWVADQVGGTKYLTITEEPVGK